MTVRPTTRGTATRRGRDLTRHENTPGVGAGGDGDEPVPILSPGPDNPRHPAPRQAVPPMRMRVTKPDFWKSPKLANLTGDWDAKLVLAGVWSYVEDNGVGLDSPTLIAAE